MLILDCSNVNFLNNLNSLYVYNLKKDLSSLIIKKKPIFGKQNKIVNITTVVCKVLLLIFIRKN